MDKEIYIEKKKKLQEKYAFPDTNYSPHLWVAIYDKIAKIEDRLDKLEKVKQ